MSQASAFLLDADDTSSFDFPANYVVLNFDTPPPIARIGGAVQDGRPDRPRAIRDRHERLHPVRSCLSLTAIRCARRAVHRRLRPCGASESGVEYTPIVNGVPSLFQGGAAFPGNDWTVSTRGEEYLSRIPPRATGRSAAFVRSTSAPPRRCSASSNTRIGTTLRFRSIADERLHPRYGLDVARRCRMWPQSESAPAARIHPSGARRGESGYNPNPALTSGEFLVGEQTALRMKPLFHDRPHAWGVERRRARRMIARWGRTIPRLRGVLPISRLGARPLMTRLGVSTQRAKPDTLDQVRPSAADRDVPAATP